MFIDVTKGIGVEGIGSCYCEHETLLCVSVDQFKQKHHVFLHSEKYDMRDLLWLVHLLHCSFVLYVSDQIILINVMQVRRYLQFCGHQYLLKEQKYVFGVVHMLKGSIREI